MLQWTNIVCEFNMVIAHITFKNYITTKNRQNSAAVSKFLKILSVSTKSFIPNFNPVANDQTLHMLSWWINQLQPNWSWPSLISHTVLPLLRVIINGDPYHFTVWRMLFQQPGDFNIYFLKIFFSKIWQPNQKKQILGCMYELPTGIT